MNTRRHAAAIVLALAACMTAGCADFRARQDLRDGLLVLNLPQRDFLAVWDRPTHTSAISGDEIIKSGIAGWGGFFYKGREMYELWEYTDRQTLLVFYDQKLVAWKTAMTVEKLAAPEPKYFLDFGASKPAAKEAQPAPSSDKPESADHGDPAAPPAESAPPESGSGNSAHSS